MSRKIVSHAGISNSADTYIQSLQTFQHIHKKWKKSLCHRCSDILHNPSKYLGSWQDPLPTKTSVTKFRSEVLNRLKANYAKAKSLETDLLHNYVSVNSLDWILLKKGLLTYFHSKSFSPSRSLRLVCTVPKKNKNPWDGETYTTYLHYMHACVAPGEVRAYWVRGKMFTIFSIFLSYPRDKNILDSEITLIYLTYIGGKSFIVSGLLMWVMKFPFLYQFFFFLSFQLFFQSLSVLFLLKYCKIDHKNKYFRDV